jgi:osmotically inducible protein OsmC
MSQTSEAAAQWQGNPSDGEGSIEPRSGAFTGPFTSLNRSLDDGNGTNPEELTAAALASCYSMALAKYMASEGLTPSLIETTARVYLNTEGSTPHIPSIHIVTTAQVDNVKDDVFQQIAEIAKENSSISRLCAGARITLEANHTAS